MTKIAKRFDSLLESLKANGFSIVEPEGYTKGVTFSVDPNTIDEGGKDPYALRFPKKAGSPRALKAALSAAEWVPVKDKFPLTENHVNRMKQKVQLHVYYFEAARRSDGKVRATGYMIPEEGKLQLGWRMPAVKAKPLDPFFNRKDDRSPMVQYCDKWKHFADQWVEPGMNLRQARKACAEQLAPLIENVPEHHREDLAVAAVATWGDISKPSEPEVQELGFTSLDSDGAKDSLKEALSEFRSKLREARE